jgi:hypothetical protein
MKGPAMTIQMPKHKIGNPLQRRRIGVGKEKDSDLAHLNEVESMSLNVAS